MPIYDRPTKELMHDFARERLRPGQPFEKNDAIAWFREHYPKIKPITVAMHVEGAAVNSSQRKHHSNIRPGSGFDLFWKTAPGQFRLWDAALDPKPIYRDDILKQQAATDPSRQSAADDPAQYPEDAEQQASGAAEFAFEKDLKNYLARNLNVIENGLRLFEDEDHEFTGIEYPVGGRFIDILAVDREGNFVVIELKVSRGYERVIGQLLRYMAWISKNLANGKNVRGVIVASEITEDLRLAASLIAGVKLWSYRIEFHLEPVST